MHVIADFCYAKKILFIMQILISNSSSLIKWYIVYRFSRIRYWNVFQRLYVQL